MWAFLKIFFYIFRIVFILVFPFALFLKSAIYIHEHYQYPAVISITVAIIILVIVLFLYLNIGYAFFFNKLGSGNALKQRLIFIVLLSVVFLFNLLFYVSSKNVKDSSLKTEYYTLHPILRLATGIFMKLDKDMVITDMSRVREDYTKMGLPINESSMHYPQKDGYCYAIDLRTRNKPAWLNFTVKWYYKLMGFKTLRHGGTGDHLHVSLYCPKKYRK